MAAFLLGYNVSIAVWVGLIALLGVDAEMSIFMLLYLDMAYQKKKKDHGIHKFQDIADSIHEGAVKE